MDLNNFWTDTYQRNIKKMIGLCFRYVSDPQVAEDLAHDSFLKAINKSDSFKSKGHFDAWLRKIAINTALQYIRDLKVKNENQQRLMHQELIYNDEELDMRHDFTTHELLEALNKLPEHHLLVFNLYVIDNYSHKQIANILNISEGTSKSHLSRAKKKLKLILNRKLKEKKTKRVFMLLFFPLGLGRLDRLYKNKFSNFEITPQNVLSFDNFNWLEPKLPTFQPGFNYNIALVSIGLTAIILFTIMFSKKDKTSLPEAQNLRTSVDTQAPQKVNDTLSVDSNTIIKVKPKQTKHPVVIKRKRIIQKTVIVQDTLKITNSDAK